MQTLQRQATPRKTLQWRPGHVPGQSNRLQVLSMAHSAIPEARGLFDPANDKDACGVGFIGAPSLHACAAPAYGITSSNLATPNGHPCMEQLALLRYTQCAPASSAASQLADWASHAVSLASCLHTYILAAEIPDNAAMRSCMTDAQGSLSA